MSNLVVTETPLALRTSAYMSARISFSGKLAEPMTTEGFGVVVAADEDVVGVEEVLLLLPQAERPAIITTSAVGSKKRRMCCPFLWRGGYPASARMSGFGGFRKFGPGPERRGIRGTAGRIGEST